MRSMLTHCTLTWATAAVAIALASASDSNGSGEAAGEASEIMQTLDSLCLRQATLLQCATLTGIVQSVLLLKQQTRALQTADAKKLV